MRTRRRHVRQNRVATPHRECAPRRAAAAFRAQPFQAARSSPVKELAGHARAGEGPPRIYNAALLQPFLFKRHTAGVTGGTTACCDDIACCDYCTLNVLPKPRTGAAWSDDESNVHHHCPGKELSTIALQRGPSGKETGKETGRPGRPAILACDSPCKSRNCSASNVQSVIDDQTSPFAYGTDTDDFFDGKRGFSRLR